MDLKKILIIFLSISIIFIFYIILKLNIPLFFANKDILDDAVYNLIELQKIKKISPSDCAERYLYYKTDYHDISPKNIITKIIEQKENKVIVKIYNPNCKDDSIKSTIDIIYLNKDKNNFWKPIKHKWAHKGRGIFGWTTKPTH